MKGSSVSTKHWRPATMLATALTAGVLVTGASTAAFAAAPQAARTEIAPANQNPQTRGGVLEIVAPASVKRGTTWPLTINLSNLPTQGMGAGPTMIILTDTTGFGGKQILRPVTIAGTTGSVQEKIAKTIPPGTYLIKVFYMDSWSRDQSSAEQVIQVTR